MIYRNSGEVSGQPPLNFKNYSGSIQDYLIKGNTSQNGTPTPQVPVDVVGCGERTENFFDGEVEQGTFNPSTGSEDANNKRVRTTFGSSLASGTYTINADGVEEVVVYVYTQNNTSAFDIDSSEVAWQTLPHIFNLSDTRYVRFAFRKNSSNPEISISEISNIMLNFGPTALPYEPYGYKLPITCGGETNNIYLGQVETTRKIKKLVLTGEEEIGLYQGLFYIKLPTDAKKESIAAKSTHFYGTKTIPIDNMCCRQMITGYWGGQLAAIQLRYNAMTNINLLRNYLQQQYAAGTPVTVWYVLATSETAIINEPLHKIGNYADTISKSQSNLPIPTISGQNTLAIPTTISPSNISLTLDQKEIGKIYEGGKKEVELSGVPPISFNAIGSQLEDYLIEGNTSQNGTPTPSDPVDVVGCGVRTGNLAYGRIENANVSSNGMIVRLNGYDIAIGRVESGIVYTANAYVYAFYTNEPMSIGDVSYDGSRIVGTVGEPSTFTAPITGYVAFRMDSGEQAMLNLGSTALPYEPYGYKLPLTVNGTEHPIYLGQVETTRRIKKLVFDGTEAWSKGNYPPSGGYQFFTPKPSDIADNPDWLTTHFKKGSGLNGSAFASYLSLYPETSILPENATTNNFKAWLAAQYAAGTPVTIWYVLAEPETGIVNEPLHKIGTYADSISKTQSNLPIPITTGSNTLSIETTVQPSNITINYNKQTEIAEVYGGIGENHPIYYMNRTIEGTSPIMFKGLGKDLKDYTILGNTSQNGTPTPEAPVDVVGCGVRTGNLFDKTQPTTITNKYLLSNGEESASAPGWMVSAYIPVNGEYLTLSGVGGNLPSICAYDSSKQFVRGESYAGTNATTISISGCSYVRFSYVPSVHDNIAMLNLGSTALPYEPYGYKLPITCEGETNNIYLGQVETTRKIKKLVLTGEETWNSYSGVAYLSNVINYLKTDAVVAICTHYQPQPSVEGVGDTTTGHIAFSKGSNYRLCIRDTTYTSATTFKQYLADQYAAGTPVTVWYVIAEPETGIVNGPLMKIGDYADTITMAQAGETIPTIAGSNTLSVGTTLQPSSVSITGHIKG